MSRVYETILLLCLLGVMAAGLAGILSSFLSGTDSEVRGLGSVRGCWCGVRCGCMSGWGLWFCSIFVLRVQAHTALLNRYTLVH